MTKIEQARMLLSDILMNGPQPAIGLIDKAKLSNISPRTLKTAKSALGIVSNKSSFDGQWHWSLPEKHNDFSAPSQGCKTVKNISRAMFVAFDQSGEKPIPIRVLPGQTALIPWSKSAQIALIGGVLQLIDDGKEVA